MANTFLDIGDNAVVGTSIVPAALTTTQAGGCVDLIESNANVASAALMVGAVSGTQGSIVVQMQECATTNGTYINCVGGGAFTAVTTSGTTAATGQGSLGMQIVSFQRQLRYVQAYVTATGTFTSMLIGVMVFAQRAVTPVGNGGWTNEQGAQPSSA